MRNKTTIVLFSVTLCLGLSAAASVRAQGSKAAEETARLPSYLGVYAMPLDATSAGGETTVYGPTPELRFEVSLTNEEGRDAFDLPGGIAGSLQTNLRHDQVDMSGLTFDWSGVDERYSFIGEDLESTSFTSLLGPDEGMKTELAVRRSDGKPFTAGAYVLTLTVTPQTVRSAQDLAWKGRGGVGGGVFRIRDVVDLEDRKNQLAIEGSGLLQQGELVKALAVYTELESLDPADPMLCGGKGITLFRMADYAGAVACFEQILPLLAAAESHSTIPELAAYAYVALGDEKRAREAIALYVVSTRIDSVLKEMSAWARGGGR